jgi:hypothetical protein
MKAVNQRLKKCRGLERWTKGEIQKLREEVRSLTHNKRKRRRVLSETVPEKHEFVFSDAQTRSSLKVYQP